MRKFIYVTNHAIERFKDRLNRPELERDAAIRIISGMAHNGIDFGGNSGTDIYKLCTFKCYKDPDQEIILVIAKGYDEEKRRPSLIVKTILTKQQALANMSQINRHVRSMSKRIAI